MKAAPAENENTDHTDQLSKPSEPSHLLDSTAKSSVLFYTKYGNAGRHCKIDVIMLSFGVRAFGFQTKIHSANVAQTHYAPVPVSEKT